MTPKDKPCVPVPRTTPHRRVRASQHALKTAIRAMTDCGLTINRLCINGATIEIHCASTDPVVADEDNGGLEKW